MIFDKAILLVFRHILGKEEYERQSEIARQNAWDEFVRKCPEAAPMKDKMMAKLMELG